MKATSKKFLHAYMNADAPVGQERNGQEVWLRNLRPFVDDYFVDTYGTAVGVINPEAPYKVVLAAHADEISWYINHITEQGYIYVIRNGGSDYEIAPSMHTTIHTQDGNKVPAIFGWQAIHMRPRGEKGKRPSVENVVLDGGFKSKKEALQQGINIGDIVTFNQKLVHMHDFFVGKALDNRIGGFIIAEVARRLKLNKQKIPFGLYFVNTVQEESGLRGARMIAERIRPNVALVTDVTHATDTPHDSKIKHGEIIAGKGPVLGIAPVTHLNLRKMLIDIAKKQKIDFQRGPTSHVTGTDTDAFAYSHQGVASALLSTPLRYMHTTVEMIHLQDVEKLIQWMYGFVAGLKKNQSFDIKIKV